MRKTNPSKEGSFFLLHVSNQNKCNIWDLEWKSLMRYGVYACIVDSWLLKLSVCWTRSIFWIKSDFFDAIHKRNSILNFFTSWLTQISFKLEFSRNCNCWSYWRWRRWSLICCSYNILLVFFKVTCKFFQAAHSLLAVRLPKHFQTNHFFLCLIMIWKSITWKKKLLGG